MWNFMQDPFLGPFVHGLGLGVLFTPVFLLLVVWTLIWKAIALWHAGRSGQRIWFVVFLLVHTVGVLEIIYLKWFEKDDNARGREKMFPFIDDIRDMVTARVRPSPASDA